MARKKTSVVNEPVEGRVGKWGLIVDLLIVDLVPCRHRDLAGDQRGADARRSCASGSSRRHGSGSIGEYETPTGSYASSLRKFEFFFLSPRPAAWKGA